MNGGKVSFQRRFFGLDFWVHYISLFIDHWHDAVREELKTDEDKHELDPLAQHLKDQIKRHRAIQTLATTPLLCAMLCALNRDRRSQLPVNRVELYRACCELLLERREKESRIDVSDYPALNLGQKERLLQDLAYWMILEQLSEADLAQVDARFSRQLAHMPNLPYDISSIAIRRLLVERSGIIREPVTGQIDFAHRTFEEFFAAQAALDMGDIDLLVGKAHDDQWREVIILAAGLASQPVCEQLIAGLLNRGDEEKASHHQIHLLAVSCLETAIQLRPEIRKEVEKRLSQLLPPKNMTEAKALAAAGELAVKHLTKKGKLSVTTCAACIRTLALIGSDAALDMLEEYTGDTRETVIKELVKAWASFDKEEFGKRILSQMAKKNAATLNNLNLSGYKRLTDMRPFVSLSNLTYLTLSGCEQLTDVSPLASLSNLSSLDLSWCEQLTDVSPLASLSNLSSLNLSGCKQLTDVSPLASLSNLSSLDLSGCKQLTDVSPLASLSNLSSLALSRCKQLTDVSPLVSLSNLSSLALSGCEQLTDVSPLVSLSNLSSLTLSGYEQLIDVSPLASLSNLSSLTLYGCEQLIDVSPLASLSNLSSLTLYGCEQLMDASPLTSLSNLTYLTLSGCKQLTDVSPLASLSNLTSLALYGCEQLMDVSPLASLSNLTSLDLSWCKQLTDVSPLASLSNLKIYR